MDAAPELCGDTGILLRRYYGNARCLHCEGTGHDHTSCPERPCYLCGAAGHLAPDCPHRRRPISRADEDQKATLNAQVARRRVMAHVRRAELGLVNSQKPPNVPSRQLEARVRARYERAHERRITAIEWMPRGRRVVSGDKRGNVALTDTGALAGTGRFQPRMSLARIHHVNVSAFAFESSDIMWSSSLDGRVLRSHVECILPGAVTARGDTSCEPAPVDVTHTALDLNPDGWHGPSKWRSATAMSLSGLSSCTVYAGTCRGSLYTLDARTANVASEQHKMHSKKIQVIDVNPVMPNLILTTGNDYVMTLWDARKLDPGSKVARYLHPMTPFGASFSPNTGTKIVTTCHDNRVRIWNDVNVLVGDAHDRKSAAPVEIVHSNNFMRYLSPFQPSFDPKDWTDDLFAVGRYLGDAYSVRTDTGTRKEAVLHPIDLFSASRGEMVGELVDMSITTRCPLNRFSPTDDIVASGMSLHLAFWAPKNLNSSNDDDHDDIEKAHREPGGGGDDDNDGDNDDAYGSSAKKKKTLVVSKKKTTRSRSSKTSAKEVL